MRLAPIPAGTSNKIRSPHPERRQSHSRDPRNLISSSLRIKRSACERYDLNAGVVLRSSSRNNPGGRFIGAYGYIAIVAIRGIAVDGLSHPDAGSLLHAYIAYLSVPDLCRTISETLAAPPKLRLALRRRLERLLRDGNLEQRDREQHVHDLIERSCTTGRENSHREAAARVRELRDLLHARR
jgi:hypothetical protein